MQKDSQEHEGEAMVKEKIQIRRKGDKRIEGEDEKEVLH